MTFSLNNNQEIISRDIALDMLISVFPDLKEQWKNYLAEEYKNYNEERLDYIDIGIVIDYIVEKKKSNETKGFDDFFMAKTKNKKGMAWTHWVLGRQKL